MNKPDDYSAEPEPVRPDATEEECLEGMKEHINNLLWARLPPSITLGAADDIAMRIYNIISAAWIDAHRR